MSFSDAEVERYARHLVLRELGGPGQQALKRSTVLIVGAGGLGAPAALYLAAAGVGRLRIADPDVVSLSNLQRQVLFDTAEVGASKTAAAAARLGRLNPHVAVEGLAAPFQPEMLAGCDLVLDGTDNFETRLAVSDASVAAGLPLVSGAIERWTGQAAVFEGRPCYRCMVAAPPPGAETCASVGVVGALAGVIGSMMALEAIKRLTGAGRPLSARLLIYDALAAETRTVRLSPDPQCPACGQDA